MTTPAARPRARMRKFRIDFVAGVDRPAQKPALAVLAKRDDGPPQPNTDESLVDYLKRAQADDPVVSLPAAVAMFDRTVAKGWREGTPVLTSEAEGHTHIVWLDGDRGGETTMQLSESDEHHHDHPWVIGEDGMVTIGENTGHTHVVAADAVLAAMREQLVEHGIEIAVVDVVFANALDDETAKLEDAEAVAKAIDAGELFVKGACPGVAMPDGSLPIRCASDLATATAFAPTAYSKARVASHIQRRARVLGLAEELPTSGELFDVLSKADGPAVGATSTEESGMSGKTTTTPNAGERVTELEAELVIAKAATEAATAAGTLTDPQRAHHATLDDVGQAAFINKSVADRDTELAAIAKGDPIVYTATDGVVFRKSDGEKLINLAKRADDQARELAIAKKTGADAVFAKRATDDFGHLTGDEADKVSLLKAVSTITDDDARGRVEAILKSHDKGIAAAMTTVGTNAGGDGADATQQLDTIAKKVVADAAAEGKSMTYVDGYAKAADANPELYAKAVTG